MALIYWENAKLIYAREKNTSRVVGVIDKARPASFFKENTNRQKEFLKSENANCLKLADRYATEMTAVTT